MTKEELAKEIAQGIIATGVEGAFDSVSCSTNGDCPSIGVSQWEGPRADQILQALGGKGPEYAKMRHSDLLVYDELDNLKALLRSERGKTIQLAQLACDCARYVEALWEVPDLDDSRCTIYAGMWCPTSTSTVCRFLMNRQHRVNLRSLSALADLFRAEYAQAASIPHWCYAGYQARAEKTFYHVAAIDLTTPYGAPEYGKGGTIL